MIYLGDYTEDYASLDFLWHSSGADGASITPSTAGTISVYKADGTTQSVVGITDDRAFDGLVGVHHVRIDLSADAFYAVSNDYSVVLSAATIDGAVVNAVIATFSIENRFAEVDVTKWRGTQPAALAASFVPVDVKRWQAGTPDTLSNQKVRVDVREWIGQNVAATTNGKPDVTVFAMLEDTITALAFAADAIRNVHLQDGVISAGKFAANAINASTIAENAIGASELAVDAIRAAQIQDGAITGDKLAASAIDKIVDQVWDELVAGHVAAGSFGKTDADILADTNELQVDDTPAAIAALNDPDAAAIADAIWDEAVAGHVAAGSFGKTDADILTLAAAISIDTGRIETDTQDIQSRLPAALVGGAIDANVSALQANAITAAAIATDAITAATIAANAIGASEIASGAIFDGAITAAQLNTLADALLVRLISNVEPAASVRNLYGAIAGMVNKREISGTDIKLYASNDTTVIATIPITVSASQDPITVIDPP